MGFRWIFLREMKPNLPFLKPLLFHEPQDLPGMGRNDICLKRKKIKSRTQRSREAKLDWSKARMKSFGID